MEVSKLGRKRKSPEEKKVTIFVTLTQAILDKISIDGEPSKIVANIITDMYKNK